MSSFFEKLENIRAKPEGERRRLTFLFSVGITAVVAFVWVVSLSFTLSSPANSRQVAAVGASDKEKVATSSSTGGFLNSNKVKIIEGWKVITNR